MFEVTTNRAMKPIIHLFAVVFLLGTGVAVRADVDLGRPTSSTVYDPYLVPMRQTFAKFGGGTPAINEVRANLRTARRFRYYFNTATPYTPQLPAVTEARREGDCKAKSLWLASKMGDGNTRYVIGKGRTTSRISHAWLLWPSDGTWYALDPTNESEILNAERIVGRKLIPQFSYTSSTRYQHPSYGQYVR